jgi:hypothetical protein
MLPYIAYMDPMGYRNVCVGCYEMAILENVKKTNLTRTFLGFVLGMTVKPLACGKSLQSGSMLLYVQ